MIECEWLVVADGVGSDVGKMLGRRWHKETVYGVAGRSYVSVERDDEWISSHMELRDERGKLLPGYGWVFPLGGGEVNLGAGALASTNRPVKVNVKKLVEHYASTYRSHFGLTSEIRDLTSALLPMGGAVTNVAGPNWALIGDAAACVNPLNGEGIDYGLETGRLVAEAITSGSTSQWAGTLRDHYGEAFSIARRLAGIFTAPAMMKSVVPLGMRSQFLMALALRWMGNLVTDEDRDTAARLWRFAGKRSIALDHRPPFS